MKKRKFYLPILILSTISILLAGCVPMTMNNVYKEPNFSGLVEEVHEGSLLVRVDEKENLGSDLISVSLDVKLKDSMTDFKVGDEIKVYYDGNIAESYPAQANTVYAIFPVEKEGVDPDQDQKDSEDSRGLNASEHEKINDFKDLSMEVKEESISPQGLTLIFKSESKNEAIYGDYFLLEEKVNGQWYEVPVSFKGDYGFNDIGYSLNKGEKKEHEEDWEWLYGSLDKGHYRIIKDVLDFRKTGDFDVYYLGAEFEIK